MRRIRKRLAGDQKGQAAVEFMLMMVTLMLVVLSIISVIFLCSDLLLARYASFVAARGYLARAEWQEGGKEAAKLVLNNTGNVEVEEKSGEGVNLKVEIKEFFPIKTLFGGSDRTTLERETLLGREPEFSGDNTPNW